MYPLSLRDDLFLLAHDDVGRLVVPRTGIGAGLAGAELINLLVAGRVTVVDGRLDVVDASSTGDPETDATIRAISVSTAPCGPRAWVGWLSHGAYHRTADVLATAGVVRRLTVRRLGLLPVDRFPPQRPADLVRARSRVRYAIHGRKEPDARTAALCGLVRVLRLEPCLLLSMPAADLRLALERTSAGTKPTVRQVMYAVDTVITTAAFR